MVVEQVMRLGHPAVGGGAHGLMMTGLRQQYGTAKLKTQAGTNRPPCWPTTQSSLQTMQSGGADDRYSAATVLALVSLGSSSIGRHVLGSATTMEHGEAIDPEVLPTLASQTSIRSRAPAR